MQDARGKANGGRVIASVENGTIFNRISQAWNTLRGKDFHGPGIPQEPVAQKEAWGRAFDYQQDHNRNPSPKGGEKTDFRTLRELADSYDLLRLVIETRKDQISKLPFTIQPRKKGALKDGRCEKVEQFLQRPDRDMGWDEWLRCLVEDRLVVDAATILPRKTRGGEIFSLDIIDGTTIKRLLDDTGRTPVDPLPAYQQVIKGLPAVDYRISELVYAPGNRRSNRVYGFSPVEQVITTVNIAMRRQISQLQYYTEGNIPEALASTPAEWSPEQVVEFQAYWDSMIEGDTAARRHMRFVPNGMSFIPTKESMLKDEYDEWLARVICFAFSLPPQALVREVNRATAETSAELAKEEGLAPLQRWVKGVMDRVVQEHFGYMDLEFAWAEEESVDPKVQAEVASIYVQAGIKSVNECREEMGLDPVQGGDELKELNPAPAPGPFSQGGEAFAFMEKLADIGKRETPQPVINVAPPSVTVEAPVVNIAPPSITVEQPAITVHTPEVRFEPVIDIAGPQIHMPAPRAQGSKEVFLKRDENGQLCGSIQVKEGL